MRLLMLSGDRQVVLGQKGPFHSMQAEFSRHFERIDVLVPRPDGPAKVLSIHERVHLHPATCGRAGMYGWLTRRGIELVREHGHALVVSHDYGWFYNGIAAGRIRAATGVPFVSEIHHVPGHPRAADLRERFDKQVARAYIRHWARARACAIRVVNAREMPPLLERWGVPRAQIAVLPSLYIDLATFRAPARAVAPRQDVVFVGRMVANKGLDRIVDALALLKSRGLPHRALFVGKGPLLGATKERAARRGLGDVRFIEWVETPADLADVYRHSRVAVCASTCEGGPRVTVEAMACGVPVVSTPVGVMPELLEDGRAGRLADFDVGSLADALGDVLADDERRGALGAEAARRAQRFEYHAMLANYAEGLKRLAAQAAAAPAGAARA
ncbi:MAG: glycosyltransferase family 1 protein [Planctomycetota bacterium]|nr:MAG: glycosyltransferase family 1 protein [Planctomycetota bacterium]